LEYSQGWLIFILAIGCFQTTRLAWLYRERDQGDLNWTRNMFSATTFYLQSTGSCDLVFRQTQQANIGTVQTPASATDTLIILRH